jgi:pimeloyl-ACP methyl ester carboxylesterase
MGNHKTTYVLVHGAWYGSWSWKRVRKALQSAGHDVFTPTLTGSGERSHLNSPAIDLSTHIADVVNLIKWEELSDVILCGHSYSGCVISGVADQMPAHIRAIVYLDAFVLEDGECLFDLFPQELVQGMRQQAHDTGDDWRIPPIPPEVFNVNKHDLGWVKTQTTPHSLTSFEEHIKFTNNLAQIQDITHILATGFDGSAIPPSHERARIKGWKTRTMASGHMIMLDHPDELVELLLEYSRA